MFLAIAVFTIVHPGKVLIGPDAEMPGVWRTIRGAGRKGKNRGRGKADMLKIPDEEGEELVKFRG